MKPKIDLMLSIISLVVSGVALWSQLNLNYQASSGLWAGAYVLAVTRILFLRKVVNG